MEGTGLWEDIRSWGILRVLYFKGFGRLGDTDTAMSINARGVFLDRRFGRTGPH
jgi:hypothetical protein